MKFGRINESELQADALHLPDDHPQTAEILARGKGNTHYAVGCPSYNHPQWRGKVYPDGPKSQDYLPMYAQQFNSLEVNSTGYAMPKPETIEKWKDVAPEGFLYCVKPPRSITHYGKLTDKLEEAESYAKILEPLGEHLGPGLLQFADRFAPKRWPELEAFLRAFKGNFPLAVELRHEQWYTEDGPWFDVLAELGYGLVITDTAGRRDVVHMRLTAPWVMVRYNGYDMHATDTQRLTEWAERLLAWQKQGLEAAYFFVHTPDKTYCPELVEHFIEIINKKGKLALKSWTPISENPRLFG